jgi:hypothetical protein
MFSLARRKHDATYRYNEPEGISAVRYEMVRDEQRHRGTGGRLQEKRHISSLCFFFSVCFTHYFTFVFLCHTSFPTFFCLLFFVFHFVFFWDSYLFSFSLLFIFFSCCFLLVSSFLLALLPLFLLPGSTRGDNLIADQAIMSPIHLSAELLGLHMK